MNFDQVLELFVGEKVRIENRFFVVDAVLQKVGNMYLANTTTAQIPGFVATDVQNLCITRGQGECVNLRIQLP